MTEWKTVTHTLAYPITVGEGSDSKAPVTGNTLTAPTVITEVLLREPDVEALERIEEEGGASADGKTMTIRQIKVCICALSGLPETTVKKFHYRDTMAMAEALAPLLEGLQE